MYGHALLTFLLAVEITEGQIAKYLTVGALVGGAAGAVIAKVVTALLRYRQGGHKISQEKTQTEFDFQQRIDASIEAARKNLIRDQNARIHKLENKVDALEAENDQCRKDYQTVLADTIAQRTHNLEQVRLINMLEDRMKKYEVLMVDKGINFIPLIILREGGGGNPGQKEGGK